VDLALQHSLAQGPAKGLSEPDFTGTAFAHLGWGGIGVWVGRRIIHLRPIVYVGFCNLLFCKRDISIIILKTV